MQRLPKKQGRTFKIENFVTDQHDFGLDLKERIRTCFFLVSCWWHTRVVLRVILTCDNSYINIEVILVLSDSMM
jgi:hypothetical protein